MCFLLYLSCLSCYIYVITSRFCLFKYYFCLIFIFWDFSYIYIRTLYIIISIYHLHVNIIYRYNYLYVYPCIYISSILSYPLSVFSIIIVLLASAHIFSTNLSSIWPILSSAAPNLILSLLIEFLISVIAFFSSIISIWFFYRFNFFGEIVHFVIPFHFTYQSQLKTI